MTTSKALETLFEMCEESNASDLHLAVGLPPRFRIKGSLVTRGDLRTFDAADVEAIALELEGAEKVPPKLPKVEVGCRFEGGGVVEWHDVTVEEAVKKVAGAVGYTFNVSSNGVVTVTRAKGHDTK